MRRVLGIGIIFLLLQCTAAYGGPIQPPHSDATLIDTLNYYRTSSGLNPVAEDTQLSTAVKKHITYLTMSDPKFFKGKYLSRHLENPASPFYTSQGARSGQELTSTLTDEQSHAVDLWMSAPLHAMGFMREGLRKVGWASAYNQRSGYFDMGADVIDGLKRGRTKEIVFPGDHSLVRIDRYQGESPDPREACGGNFNTFTGLPLWVSLTSRPPSQMSAQITTPSGEVLSSRDQICIVNEYNIKSSDLVYGPAGKAIVRTDHMVLIIPRNPLAAGVQQVTLSMQGRASISWTFTVIASPPDIALSPTNGETTISWGAPVSQPENPTIGYEVLVGNSSLKSFQVFKAITPSLSLGGLNAGKYWLCVRVIAKYRSGQCSNFYPFTVGPSY